MSGALVILFVILWAGVTFSDVRHRRGAGAKLGATLMWGWMGVVALTLFGQSASRFPGVAVFLTLIGAFFLLLGFLAVRQPGNLQARFALLWTLGSAGATVAMLAIIVVTGPAITSQAKHARDFVGLTFVDVLLGVPVLASLLSPSAIAAFAQKHATTYAVPGAPLRHHRALLPHAKAHLFVPGKTPSQVRALLSADAVAAGTAPGEPPRYRGMVPGDGPFSLTRYVMQKRRYAPVTFDVETAPHGDGTDLTLHAREGGVYLVATLPGLVMGAFAAVTSWSQLSGADVLGRERATTAIEVASFIGFVMAFGCALLIHHFGTAFLGEDRIYLARLLGVAPETEPTAKLGAFVRLLAASLFLGIVAIATLTVGVMVVEGALSGNGEIVRIGLVCALGYGLMFSVIAYAGRTYFRGGWKRDMTAMRARGA
jgi:hypothetical protein